MFSCNLVRKTDRGEFVESEPSMVEGATRRGQRGADPNHLQGGGYQNNGGIVPGCRSHFGTLGRHRGIIEHRSLEENRRI